MIWNKEQVKIIKEAHDKDDTDSRNPKAVAFGILFADYCSSNSALKKLSPAAGNALIGYSIQESILERYGILEIDQLKEVVKFLQATYRAARN